MAYSRTYQATILNAIRGLSLELALYTSNPTKNDTGIEVVSGGYSRRAITFDAVATTSDGSYIANSGTISFPQASADWSAGTPITHFGIRVVGGNLLSYGELSNLGVSTSRVVRFGDTFQVAAGSLVIKEMD